VNATEGSRDEKGDIVADHPSSDSADEFVLQFGVGASGGVAGVVLAEFA
jgi:hypothetical protein